MSEESEKKFDISIFGKIETLKSEVKFDTIAYASKLNYIDNWLTLTFINKETKDVYSSTALIEKKNDDFGGWNLPSSTYSKSKEDRT